jgi:hypothetical protein
VQASQDLRYRASERAALAIWIVLLMVPMGQSRGTLRIQVPTQQDRRNAINGRAASETWAVRWTVRMRRLHGTLQIRGRYGVLVGEDEHDLNATDMKLVAQVARKYDYYASFHESLTNMMAGSIPLVPSALNCSILYTSLSFFLSISVRIPTILHVPFTIQKHSLAFTKAKLSFVILSLTYRMQMGLRSYRVWKLA